MKKTKVVSLQKMKWNLWLLGVFKIPMIAFVRPRLLKMTDEEVLVKIKFRRKTKNHLKSMYFGALAVGADIAAGIHAFYFAETLGHKVSFAFKGMDAAFLKRAESDVFFNITQGLLIKEAIEESARINERINQDIEVQAEDEEGELVATFIMIVSVKVKK